MKPLIIYVDSEKDEINLSRKQFEKLIQEAYQQGYDSGYQVGYHSNHYWPYVYTNTTTSNPPTITYTTGTDPNTFNPSVTCSSEQSTNVTGEVHNSIGD